MNFKLIMKPLEDGGTCILSYEPELHDKMEKTLLKCGREDLILCSAPVIYPNKYSLHLISDKEDLTDWWEACMIVSEEDNHE
jgi:hypothetical protein